jgi:hypothetical protein
VAIMSGTTSRQMPAFKSSGKRIPRNPKYSNVRGKVSSRRCVCACVFVYLLCGVFVLLPCCVVWLVALGASDVCGSRQIVRSSAILALPWLRDVSCILGQERWLAGVDGEGDGWDGHTPELQLNERKIARNSASTN